MEFWSDGAIKVIAVTENNLEVMGLVVARFERIVWRSAGEIVKLKSGVRSPNT